MRWGKQPGYVVFAGQKTPLERPRVRTREGQEVELQSYGQLQQDGKLQRAVQERVVAGLSTRIVGTVKKSTACSLLVRTEFRQQMSKFRTALEASELWFSARLLGGVASLKCLTQVC